MTYKNKYIFRITCLLAALFAGSPATALADGVVVHGNVYGGGNEADVNTNTTVNMSAGQVNGNVYGGGNLGYVGKVTITEGYRTFTWDEGTGVCNVNITGGTVGPDSPSDKGNVFGAGKGVGDTFWCEKGIVYQTNVNISAGTVKGNVYGGGEVGRVETNATVTLGTAEESGDGSKPDIKGSVFGAGAGLETHGYSALVRGNTTVTVQGIAKVGENVYGGGQIAAVGKYSLVTVDNQAEHPGLEVGMPYSLVDDGLGICNVTVKDHAKIGHDGAGYVYGAGMGLVPREYTYADNEHRPKRMMTYNSEVFTEGNHATWEYADAEHQYVWEYFPDRDKYLTYIETLGLATQTVVTIDGSASISGSVYGGSESGFVQHNTSVTVQGSSTIGTTGATGTDGNVFGGGLGIEGNPTAGRVSGSSTVAIKGGLMKGSVYGGGKNGIVKCNVDINMTGGRVNHDVYGGGALANTNTAHRGATDDDLLSYVEVSDLIAGASLVTGYYTKSGDDYTLITTPNTKATEGTKYYAIYKTAVNLLGGTIDGDAYGGGLGRVSKTAVAADPEHGIEAQDAVTAIEAIVFGDTKVNLNGMTVGERNAASSSIQAVLAGTVIDGNDDGDVTDEDEDYHVVSSRGCAVSRVFGCNDLNGTPKGNVTVHVFATQNKDASKANISAKFVKDDADISGESDVAKLKGYLLDSIKIATALSITVTDYQAVYDDNGATADAVREAITNISSAVATALATGTDEQKAAKAALVSAVRYDVKAVYGGGNEAAYIPATAWNGTTGSKSQVIIEGCEYTSIETVYGGGNAAAVPETNVTVNAAYEIGSVFGGGNGKDRKSDGSENPGADVGIYNSANYGTGNVSTLLLGGRIHEAYGGSNQKGNIVGTVYLNSEDGGPCTLEVDKMVSAGKNADLDGDAIVTLGCLPDSKIGQFFGGADNANVHGRIQLTITSGHFGQVFGGNNLGGVVSGSITLNIEETGCRPIIIDELYCCGNEAMYSVYHDDEGNPLEITQAEFEETYTTEEARAAHKSNDPILNVISCTYIGKVFGGGLGEGAKVYGNPTVNINMIQGEYASSIPTYMTAKGLTPSENPNKLGIIGDIYGGGNEADVIGNPTVNIGTAAEVELVTTPDNLTANGNGKYDVVGAYIAGNVFGGGMGVADLFKCEKAMVNGSTNVNIGQAEVAVTVEGSVFGGGEVGRVEENTSVTIGLDAGETAPVIKGSVFGAGAGVNTHGYSALVRGNSTVIVQGDAKVKQSVYGGGDIASVGRYNVADEAYHAEHPEVEVGMPYSLANNGSGYCTVIIRGNAEIGPDDMVMMNTTTGRPDDWGHVFGAGKGVLPYEGYGESETPWRMPPNNVKEYYYGEDNEDYLRYVETLGLATQSEVTIGGNAFIKGSVYGGSENGHVQHDTHVKIQDNCQIGNGYVQMADDGTYLAAAQKYSLNRRYTAEEWEAGHLIKDGETNYTSSMPECASWLYGQADAPADRYAPYDPYYGTEGYDSKGGRSEGDDGHTFFGNVFGGGSGLFAYAPGKWHDEAGSVGGNTVVDITGGHILTNVYGGNELTNVGKGLTGSGGKCTINFGGTATLGVPRTLGQILAHPVTCYLFGAGKGDQRVYFKKSTNVKDVEITITGGTIYGSVFGGGEDGHVKRDVTMTIGNAADHTGPTIGTWGTSYVDGNVFGGGRGFGGDAYTAGNVAGSIGMTVHGGTVLGSIYGGGRLGSVGYGLYDENETGKYGTMRPDNFADDGTTPVADFKRGHVDITITGGTIGNDHEYTYNPSEELRNGILRNTTFEDYTFKEKKADGESTTTVTEEAEKTTIKRLLHTRGGNVFVGGMGRRLQLDGVTPITAIDWMKLGAVKSTKLTVTGGHIKSNVYGGGEFGGVIPSMDSDSEPPVFTGGTTEIDIQGGTIGTEIKKDGITQYTFGSVFGGGMGDVTYGGGDVRSNTTVSVVNATVLASVYGGGEMATVQGNSNVTIDGTTTVGLNKVRKDDGYVMYGGSTMGNVYGAGLGSIDNVNAGKVEGNTTITIGETGSPEIYHNVYGGGAYASVGKFDLSTDENKASYYVPVAGIPVNWSAGTGRATLNILGGIVGISGRDNGMVCGSSRGDISNLTTLAVPAAPGTPGADPFDKVAWVKESVVNIGNGTTGPLIKGSVYGGGENGHNAGNAMVNVKSGTIGITDTNDPWFTFTDEEVKTKSLNTRGNIYGSGCGTDTYEIVKTYGTGSSATTKTFEYNNPWSGIVRGNTKVNISGGHVTHSVYGGGSMGSVGTITNWEDTLTVAKHQDIRVVDGKDVVYGLGLSWPYKFEYVDTTGTATVTVTGGRIGIDDTNYGDVYGAPRGKAGDRYAVAHLANVRETVVTVNYATTPAYDEVTSSTPYILGSVFGGGADGHVLDSTIVEITGGLIGHSVYGGGKGDGTYEGVLKATTGDHAEYPTTLCDWTSGKIYGNTRVTMRGGHVMRNVYGGGNLGSVGKGNYAGGLDDYYPAGYGETLEAENLWDGLNANSQAFLRSGKTNVTILDGVIGTADGLNAGMPTGSVFGGSRGKAAEDVGSLSPRYEYAPDFFLGYVNEAEVTIGDTDHAPIIWASVYGGGRDGHVRRSTHVAINNGTIGKAYTSGDITDSDWKDRGNVYGSGSGMSTLHGTINDKDEHGTSSGSVTRDTRVDITGGTIYNNVYGGGALSSVGPPKIGPIADPDSTVTICRVNISGGTIGTSAGYAAGYGGGVYGAGRGGGLLEGEDDTKYATSVWTKVHVMPHASGTAAKNPVIEGSVFGGGNAGPVLRDTEVLVTGGTINHNVYGGGNVAEVKGHANVTIGQKKATPAPAPAPGREPVPAPAPAP